MSDEPTSNVAEFTVSELSGSIKKTVEGAFSHVRLRGEISGFRGPHSSGHAYFSIKDERARMDAVVWKGVYNRLKFKPEEGMEMIATGKITTYPGSSKYQIVIEQLEPAGAGALMALLEERKKKLGAEGLFDAERKQLLPHMPKVIGVVTSPTGAVIRDILHRISDRFPIHVVVWPVRVQGETSGDEVAAAINGFNRADTLDNIPQPDVIIVARGGGSLEDLWGFNDEAVVRAASNSDIPLISAVGHETDWTLLDLVADERAPTPTGAAEMAVPVKAELEALVANLAARLGGSSTRLVDQRKQHFRALARALPSLDNLLALPRRRIDEAQGSLTNALKLNLINKRRTFERSEARLTPHSLTATLSERRTRVQKSSQTLGSALERIADRKRAQYTQIARSMAPVPNQLNQQILQHRKSLNLADNRAKNGLENKLSRLRQSYQAQVRMLASLSYKSVLRRGFAVIRADNDSPITSSNNVSSGQNMMIEFSDGRVEATAGSTTKAEPLKAKKTPTKDARPTKQGSLF